MFKSRLSLIAPVHNEQEIIEEFVRRTYNTFLANKLKGEILLIDDGSTDATKSILARLEKEIRIVRVVSHKKNRGLTAAIITGIENAKNDIVVFLPSDLESHPEEDIPKLLAPLEHGYDMVVGRKDHKTRSFAKGVSARLFNATARILFGVNVHDLGWVKAFRKEIYYNVETLRSDWHRFFVILAANSGYRIKEVPTRFYPRKAGRSHYGRVGIKRAGGAFSDMIVIKFLSSFSRNPMRIFGTFGFIFMFIGILIGLYLVYLGLFVTGSVLDRTPLILLVVLLILTGVQSFAMEFLAELIVSFREDMRMRLRIRK